jgi:hypothetical protein
MFRDHLNARRYKFDVTKNKERERERKREREREKGGKRRRK